MREQYTEFYKDKERWRYLKKLDTNHSLLSLEGFADGEGNVIDFIADEVVDVSARKALAEPDIDAQPQKERPKRKPGCAQRIKEGLPVMDIHVTLTPEKRKGLFGNYQWGELPDQSDDVLRYT